MKRVLAILSAAIFLFGSVACEKEKYAEFDLSKATAPVLGSYTVDAENGVSAKYTPGNFGQSFNEKMPVNHSFAIVELDGEPVSKTLSTKNSDGVLSISAVNLSKALIALGKKEGANAALSLAIRASMQDPSRDNGINGFVDSEARIKIPAWLVEIPEIVGSPYQDYNEASDWSLIGHMENYDIDWNADLNMWTDGAGNHVAAHVALKAGDQVKFRKDQDWAVNYGGDFSSLDTEFSVTQDGPNIAISADGIYDLFLSTNDQTAIVSLAYDPYPELVQASNWSVIGALSKHGINWDGDIAMVTDGNVHAAFSVSLAADDQFKFRQDKDWAVNLGGDFGGLDNDFSVTQDGPNITVGAEGVYDLFVTPNDGTAKVTAASGLKVSAVIGGEGPGPEPEPVTGWNIIGLNGDWENDVKATAEGNVWTAFVTATEDTQFKWRKDGDWAENYGAPGDEEPYTVTLGVPFEAVAGGKNIGLPAGFYKVVLDLDALTITVSAGDVYALIGEINGTSWDTDFILAEEGGVFTSDVVYITGGFKIRHNYSWADEDTYGAEGDVTVGTAFTAVQPGGNISVPAGNYKVQFTPATKEVLITEVGFELPDIDLSKFEPIAEMAGAETWGIIGPAANDWNTDVDLQKIQDDPEIWAVMNVPMQADKFKFRGNDTWGDYDLGGGTFAIETPIVMTKGGSDMTSEAGVYTVYLYPTYGVAYFAKGTGDVPEPPAKPKAWSLIGTIQGTSWDTDFDLTNTSGDVWKISNFAIGENELFKIRADHDWNKSYGGPEANATSPANPEEGAYIPTLGTAFAAGSVNILIQTAGVYDVTLDYGAETILIEEHKDYPDHLYMIGQDFGGWDWNSDGVVEMIPVINNEWGGDATGQFYTIQWIKAGNGFKFCAKRAWDGDFYSLGTDDGYTVSDNNCVVAADGTYLVHIDFKNQKVHVEPARVYGIGDCFGGWNEAMEDVLFKPEGNTLKCTTKSSGNVRMYAASEIATSAWWTREFNIIDGKIVYRTGDELAAPSAGAGQVVTIDFSNGTGSIAGETHEEPWGLIGWHSMDAWTTNMTMTEVIGHSGWLVCEKIGALAGNISFKFRKGGDWNTQVGALYKTNKELNTKIKLTKESPNDINLTGNGLYDIYFNPTEMLCVILDSGTAFAVPAEWEKDPSQVVDAWGIIGSAVEKGWTEDTAMFEECGIDGYWAIKALPMKGNEGFKFRANHTWGSQLTAGGAVAIGTPFELINGEGNADTTIPEDGIYDVYLAKDLKTAVIVKAGNTPPIGEQDTFDYSPSGAYKSNSNLWLPVDGAKAAKFFMYMNIAQDWSNPKYDNVSTTDCPYCEFKQSTYKLTLADQTFDRWQNQFYIFPGDESKFIPLDPAKKYKFSVTLQSTKSFGAFFKLSKYDPNNNAQGKYEGAAIFEPEGYPNNVNFEAGKPVVVEKEFTGVEAPNINLIFDFGGNPAGTVVYIKDIVIMEVQDSAPAVNIKIDGDMSDWAKVEGTVLTPTGEEGVEGAQAIAEVKGYADNDYIYVYVKRVKLGRWTKLWGGEDNAGYYYYDFDMDNNAETGDYAENSHGNYECWTYLYIFGGSADAPVFRATPPGSAKGMKIDNVKCNGVVTTDAIETEIAFPRADLATITSDTIGVTVWGNKDGNPLVKTTFTVK